MKKTFPQLLTKSTMSRSKNRGVKERKSISEQPIIIELDQLLQSCESSDVIGELSREVEEEEEGGENRGDRTVAKEKAPRDKSKGVQAQTELLLSILQQTAQTNPDKR